MATSAKFPKYRVIAQDIRAAIERGELKPGERLGSFEEMRARHGITPTTVQRIYAELERENLIERKRGSGIFVAQPRQRRKTSIIAFRHDLQGEPDGSEYWYQLIRGTQRGSMLHGLDTLLTPSLTGVPFEKIDGAIMHFEKIEGAATYFEGKILESWPALMPVVNLMTPLDGVPSVVADDAAGARLAVEHLIGLGHRRIGCFMWFERPMAAARLGGYTSAMMAAGIMPEPQWIRGMRWFNTCAWQYEQGAANMREWLEAGFLNSGCTALLIHNDLRAWGAIDVLREAGLSVPRDISIVGFDGLRDAGRRYAALTTVEVPLEAIAETAVDILARLVREEKVPTAATVLPVALRVGETTMPPNQ